MKSFFPTFSTSHSKKKGLTSLRLRWRGFYRQIFAFAIVVMITFVVLVKNGFPQTDSTAINLRQIEISGNRLFFDKQLKQFFSKEKYTQKELENILSKIANLYREKSFPFAEINGKKSDDTLRLYIDEGPGLEISSIYLDVPDSNLLAALESQIDLRDKNQVPRSLFFNIENLLSFLENHGYPFAEIAIDSLSLQRKDSEKLLGIEFFLKVSPGEKVYIDEIHVSGNNLTKTSVILREGRLKAGMLYRQNQIDKLPERLLKTGFFTKVQPAKIAIDEKGKGHLLIDVVEGNPNQVNAVIGYNPATTRNEKGYFTGLIDISFKNLFGTGRVVKTFWQKKDRRSQELRFHYLERWALGYPLHVGFGFDQTIRDTTYVRRSMGIDLEVPFSDLLTIRSHLGKESILPDSLGQILYGLQKSSANLIRIGFVYDSRENPWNPARGIFYQTKYEFARKRISSLSTSGFDSTRAGNFRRDKIEMDAELYVPTFRYQTFLIALHGRQVKSTEPSLSVADLYRLGGTNNLRGYREDEFMGERLAWLNLEYRYLLGLRSRAFLFFDAGYIMHKKEDHKITEQTKFSYGFGFRIETRLGIIGVDYGIGQGRGLAGGLVHVGLMNKF